jgi:hypothetical protein
MTFNGCRGRWLKMKNPACEAVRREEDEYKRVANLLLQCNIFFS